MSRFDISQIVYKDDVTESFTAFFNQHWIQKDLGARVNFTSDDHIYEESMFYQTGDPMRTDISHVNRILQKGLNVALVFGDRDYECNCKYLAETNLFQKKKRFINKDKSLTQSK